MHPAFAPLAFIEGLGGFEMMLVFVLVLILFGGQKLPEFARGLGKTMREFKKAAAGVEEEFKRALDDDERRKNASAIATTATPAALTAPAAPETTPAPDPYHDHTEHDYYDQDRYSEGGPEVQVPVEPDPAAEKLKPATSANPEIPAAATETTPTAPAASAPPSPVGALETAKPAPPPPA